MEETKLMSLMKNINYKHTCMVTCAKDQMNEISEFINDNKPEKSVLVKISLQNWEKSEDEFGVKYDEQFWNIMQNLMDELSKISGIDIDDADDSEFEMDVSNTLLPLLEKIVEDGKKCYIIIENFECMNTIFPDDGMENGKEHIPLEQLSYLSAKNNTDTDTLDKTYVILLSDILIEDVEIYKYKNRFEESEWPYFKCDEREQK